MLVSRYLATVEVWLGLDTENVVWIKPTTQKQSSFAVSNMKVTAGHWDQTAVSRTGVCGGLSHPPIPLELPGCGAHRRHLIYSVAAFICASSVRNIWPWHWAPFEIAELCYLCIDWRGVHPKGTLSGWFWDQEADLLLTSRTGTWSGILFSDSSDKMVSFSSVKKLRQNEFRFSAAACLHWVFRCHHFPTGNLWRV